MNILTIAIIVFFFLVLLVCAYKRHRVRREYQQLEAEEWFNGSFSATDSFVLS